MDENLDFVTASRKIVTYVFSDGQYRRGGGSSPHETQTREIVAMQTVLSLITCLLQGIIDVIGS